MVDVQSPQQALRAYSSVKEYACGILCDARRRVSNRRALGLVLRGASVLENPHGTAPGQLLEHEQGTIVLLPGPPREHAEPLPALVVRDLQQPVARELGPVAALDSTKWDKLAGYEMSDEGTSITSMNRRYLDFIGSGVTLALSLRHIPSPA